MSEIKISIVIPLYNESAVFPLLIERLDGVVNTFKETLEIVLVDDGSSDNTAVLMGQKALMDEHYQCVFLSRNYGHPIALSAGLAYANGTEGVMVMDGDLQDPPELLEKFYTKYKEGFDVIYAVRKRRKEGFAKKISYYLYYRLIKKISEIDLPLDSGDFGFISRRVVNLLNKMPEQSRYLRGMRTWVGLKQIGLEYERDSRAAGTAKYDFKMLFRLAYNGIFNFSEVPIKVLTNLGGLAIITSLIFFVYSLGMKIFSDTVPSGFTSLLFVITLFGGVQLVSIGILGEYIIRIFFQVKGRPLFIVNERIENKELVQEKY